MVGSRKGADRRGVSGQVQKKTSCCFCPTNIASVHLVMGCPNARALVKIAKERIWWNQCWLGSHQSTTVSHFWKWENEKKKKKKRTRKIICCPPLLSQIILSWAFYLATSCQPQQFCLVVITLQRCPPPHPPPRCVPLPLPHRHFQIQLQSKTSPERPRQNKFLAARTEALATYMLNQQLTLSHISNNKNDNDAFFTTMVAGNKQKKWAGEGCCCKREKRDPTNTQRIEIFYAPHRPNKAWHIMHGIERVTCGAAVQHIWNASVATWRVIRCFGNCFWRQHGICLDKVSQHVLCSMCCGLLVGERKEGRKRTRVAIWLVPFLPPFRLLCRR